MRCRSNARRIWANEASGTAGCVPGSDAIPVGETLDLVDLVEDEVLLSLRWRHAREGECPLRVEQIFKE